jgi:CDP-diglyceride synthetase
MLAVLHCVCRCCAHWWLLLVAWALAVTALWRWHDFACFKVRDRVHQWKALTSFLLRFLTSIAGSSDSEAIAPDFLLDIASFPQHPPPTVYVALDAVTAL